MIEILTPIIVRNENVRRFIHLQEKANRMIETYGMCSDDVANELEELADKLSPEEIDETLRIWEEKHARPYGYDDF
jgi:hypothetical protein